MDLIALEMLSDVDHSRVAIEAALETGLPVWAGFSCGPADDRGVVRLLDSPPEESFADALAALPLSRVAMANVMHTQVADVAAALQVVRANWSGPTGAYPHHGIYKRPSWPFDDAMSPEALAKDAESWVGLGARMLGTCCGTGVDHIRLLHDRFAS